MIEIMLVLVDCKNMVYVLIVVISGLVVGIVMVIVEDIEIGYI